MTRFVTALAIALGLAGIAPAANAKPTTTSFYQWDRPSASVAPGTLLRLQEIKTSRMQRYRAWRILYMTRDYAGRPIISSGTVALSSYASPNPDARGIISWAHPTTGVARKCAPSLLSNPFAQVAGFNEMIGGGYIVTATDYPGLGTRGPVGYLVGLGQGRAVIDAVRAARQIPEVGGSARYGVWGYSQGGHAALFAARIATSYAPELQLVGAAAAAPPSHLKQLLAADIGNISGRVLAAFTLQSWSVKYGASLEALVDDGVAPVISAVASHCIGDLGQQLDVLAAQKPLKERFLKADPGRVKPWGSLLDDNSLFQLPPRVPVFIAQGDRDEIVRPEVTLAMVRASCRAGVRVRYLSLRNTDHSRAARMSAAEAIRWLSGRFSGEAAPNSCR